MSIKAIATDIDGTLLDSNRQLSVRTIKAFKGLDRKMPVILASSRMPSAMTHLQRELGVEGHPLVCYNGGYVIQYNGTASPKVFTTVTIPLDVCLSIHALVKETDIHLSLYFEDNWYAPRMDKWTEREETITKVKATIEGNESAFSRWKQNGNGAHKLMCMGSEEEIAALYQRLNELHGNDIHVYRSRSTYLELAPKAISKATGVRLALEPYNISMEDVMAFGDNYNDIDMLQAVGYGVAVANGRDEVKAVAKEIAGVSYEDGVARVVEGMRFNV